MMFTLKEKYGKTYTDELEKKARKSFHWAWTLMTVTIDSALGAFYVPNPQDITIYNKVKNEPTFFTVLEGFGREITMDNLINQVT